MRHCSQSNARNMDSVKSSHCCVLPKPDTLWPSAVNDSCSLCVSCLVCDSAFFKIRPWHTAIFLYIDTALQSRPFISLSAQSTSILEQIAWAHVSAVWPHWVRLWVVCYRERTMPFLAKCCPVMKRWNCCCCSCDLRTAAIMVGWICMVRHSLLPIFFRIFFVM